MDIQIHLSSKSEKVPECFLTPFGFNEASDFEPDYGEPVKIQFRYHRFSNIIYHNIMKRINYNDCDILYLNISPQYP